MRYRITKGYILRKYICQVDVLTQENNLKGMRLTPSSFVYKTYPIMK